MSNYKKKKGAEGEKLALRYYLDRGYTLLETNFTMRGWELDIVLKKWDSTIFVEVKVVDHVDCLIDYITPQKFKNLKKTIEAYVRKNNVDTYLRVDVVFVKNQQIYEVYENITLSENYF